MNSDQEFAENQSEPSVKTEEKSALGSFLAQYEQEPDVEKRIRITIDFMRAAISQAQSPRFKDFWEGRRLCIPLFKEAINPKSRALLWAEYIELSQEARRLKEILDEQSAFAAEQIGLAISALESDLERYDDVLSHVAPIEYLETCESLHKHVELYDELQRELNLLNTLASRINALRKEVIKTDMRIRYKNRFFERLSVLGDRIFPRRKELIKKISDLFSADVEGFIQAHFVNQTQEREAPLFALREEIKALQAIAKILTLNTAAFTETRLRLSECWDHVKEREKERKKEFAVKKQVFKQNYEDVLAKIKTFSESVLSEAITQEEAALQSEQIAEYMKGVELGRDEVRALREELHRARKPILDKVRQEEQERENRYKEIERQKKERTEAVKRKLTQLVGQAKEMENEALISSRDELLKELEELSLSKSERQIVDRLLKQLKEELEEKREKAILNLSEDDLKSLDQLNQLLEERKEERQEIKNQLENYRKALGGSGFDFEKAMAYRELIETEKARLDKVNASINEIEEKISELEG